jgi:SpoVK/Ycf46/Vps4 family AAA+-type ATPase
MLLVGVPGSGKSLTAKAVATTWGIPLIHFDLGKLFQGVVGSSEANARAAIQTAEAVAPCVLWMDEIEKGMAGASSSGSTDSGVTARVMGTILQWMQDRSRPVFVVATANQVNNLPPELLRAGRWDEVFAVDLPSKDARVEILNIHLKAKKRNPEDFLVDYLASETAQFSGAELEAVVLKGLHYAFADGKRPLTTDDLMSGVHNTIPLAVTRKEDIDALREWAKTRALPASSDEAPEIEASGTRTRKIRMEAVITEETIGPDDQPNIIDDNDGFELPPNSGPQE